MNPATRRVRRTARLATFAASVALSWACESRPSALGPGASPAPAEPARAPTNSSEPAPLQFLELLTGNASATETLPMIVAIHGLGDSPSGFSGAVRGISARARVLVPRAPEPYGRGFAWFPPRGNWNEEDVAKGVATAADRVADFIRWAARERPTRGRPIVTGFSQGGMLSFAVAVQSPELVSAAYPVGGLLPRPLWPTKAARLPPIVAFHGEADPVVPFDGARSTVDHLKTLSEGVRLVAYPGVHHAIPPPMRTAWHGELSKAALDAGR